MVSPSPSERGQGVRSVSESNMDVKGKTTGFISKQPFFLILVIFSIVVVASILNPHFLTQSNMFAILQQIAVLGIVTMSMVLLLISGLIDLSVGGMIGLATVTITKSVMAGMPLELALLIGIALCLGCGLLNGVIVSKSKCVPLIVTLGMSYVYAGLALVISQGVFLSLKTDFDFLGRGKIFGIPVSVIILLVVISGTHLLLKFTTYGRRIVALGGNEEVAFLAGIQVDRYKMINYTLSGGLIALASLVLLSRLGSVLATVGNGYELRALAAAVIGGVTFEGGRGTVFGAFLGVILLGLVANAMNILNVSSYYQTVVLGVIIVSAVVVSNLGKIKG